MQRYNSSTVRRNGDVEKCTNSEDILYSLKELLSLFHLVGIPLQSKPQTNGTFLAFIWKMPEICFHVMSFYTCILCISVTISYAYEGREINLAAIGYATTGLVLKYAIYFRRKRIGNFIAFVAQYYPRAFTVFTISKIKKYVRIGCMVNLFYVIIMYTLIIMSMQQQQFLWDLFVKNMFFGLLKNDNFIASDILVYGSLLFYLMCSLGHLFIFAALHSVLAFFFAVFFNKLTAKAAKSSTTTTYLLEEYGKIDLIVAEMDNIFSFLVLLEILAISNSVYFPLVAVIYGKIASEVYPYVICAISIIFSLTVVSLLSTYSAKIHNDSRELSQYLPSIHSGKEDFINKLWLSLKMKQSIFLTVWKIYPLTSSFPIVYLGTLFTYSLIINTM